MCKSLRFVVLAVLMAGCVLDANSQYIPVMDSISIAALKKKAYWAQDKNIIDQYSNPEYEIYRHVLPIAVKLCFENGNAFVNNDIVWSIYKRDGQNFIVIYDVQSKLKGKGSRIEKIRERNRNKRIYELKIKITHKTYKYPLNDAWVQRYDADRDGSYSSAIRAEMEGRDWACGVLTNYKGDFMLIRDSNSYKGYSVICLANYNPLLIEYYSEPDFTDYFLKYYTYTYNRYIYALQYLSGKHYLKSSITQEKKDRKDKYKQFRIENGELYYEAK